MMIILVGASGSGKSTYIQNHYPGFVVCSADNFMMVDGEYKWSADKLASAHQQCFAQARRALEAGASVGIDNTNTRAKERQQYLDLAKQLGVEVEIHCLPWKPEYLARNVHGVSPDNVQRQVDRIDLDTGWVYDQDSDKLRGIE